MFTNCDETCGGWDDLERAYKGTKFGTLFVLTYSGHGKPTILPSQRGLFIKR